MNCPKCQKPYRTTRTKTWTVKGKGTRLCGPGTYRATWYVHATGTVHGLPTVTECMGLKTKLERKS